MPVTADRKLSVAPNPASIPNVAGDLHNQTPLTIAFDDKAPRQVDDLLRHAHNEHHEITDAPEHGQAARAEALLKEHVHSQKRSKNLSEHRPGLQQAVASRASGRKA